MEAMWHLINEEVGKSFKGGKKIELYSGTKIISDPQIVADVIFFAEIIDDLLSQNDKNNTDIQMQKQRINCYPNTILLHPVTEYEIVCVRNSLKGNLSKEYDDTFFL
jgi:hypothetical protein